MKSATRLLTLSIAICSFAIQISPRSSETRGRLSLGLPPAGALLMKDIKEKAKAFGQKIKQQTRAALDKIKKASKKVKEWFQKKILDKFKKWAQTIVDKIKGEAPKALEDLLRKVLDKFSINYDALMQVADLDTGNMNTPAMRGFVVSFLVNLITGKPPVGLDHNLKSTTLAGKEAAKAIVGIPDRTQVKRQADKAAMQARQRTVAAALMQVGKQTKEAVKAARKAAEKAMAANAVGTAETAKEEGSIGDSLRAKAKSLLAWAGEKQRKALDAYLRDGKDEKDKTAKLSIWRSGKSLSEILDKLHADQLKKWYEEDEASTKLKRKGTSLLDWLIEELFVRGYRLIARVIIRPAIAEIIGFFGGMPLVGHVLAPVVSFAIFQGLKQLKKRAVKKLKKLVSKHLKKLLEKGYDKLIKFKWFRKFLERIAKAVGKYRSWLTRAYEWGKRSMFDSLRKHRGLRAQGQTLTASATIPAQPKSGGKVDPKTPTTKSLATPNAAAAPTKSAAAATSPKTGTPVKTASKTPARKTTSVKKPSTSGGMSAAQLTKVFSDLYRGVARARIDGLLAARDLLRGSKMAKSRAKAVRGISQFRVALQTAFRSVHAVRSRFRRVLSNLKGATATVPPHSRASAALRAAGMVNGPLAAPFSKANSALETLSRLGTRLVQTSVAAGGSGLRQQFETLSSRLERALSQAKKGLEDFAGAMR